MAGFAVHSAQLRSPGRDHVDGRAVLVEAARAEAADVVVEPAVDAGSGEPPMPVWA